MEIYRLVKQYPFCLLSAPLGIRETQRKKTNMQADKLEQWGSCSGMYFKFYYIKKVLREKFRLVKINGHTKQLYNDLTHVLLPWVPRLFNQCQNNSMKMRAYTYNIYYPLFHFLYICTCIIFFKLSLSIDTLS